MANTRVFRRSDFSMGPQNASSWLRRQAGELVDSRNVRFNEEIGAIVRRNGYKSAGAKFTTTNKKPTGYHTAQFTTGAREFIAVNNDDDTKTLIRVREAGGSWTTISDLIPADADVYFCDYRDEVYVSGVTVADEVPFPPLNINKDLDVSTTRNLLYAPLAKYFVVYRGVMYAANVLVDGARHADRIYKSSAPTGAFTFVRGAQTNSFVPQTLINQVPVMTSNTAPFGVVTGSGPNYPTEAPWMAFDQNIGTQWLGGAFTGSTGNGNPNGILTYDFGSGNAKTITAYRIMGFRPDVPARSPRSWTLEGSNNNTSWTVLDTRTNQPDWTIQQDRQFSLGNTASYRYYRLVVTATKGGANGENVNIKEFALLTSLEGQRVMQLNVDSTRYVKAGMNVEVYKSGTNTKLYEFTVSLVDKPNNRIEFLPESYSVAAVDAAADTITISSTTTLQTGTPVLFSSNGTLPAPLAFNVQYYAINVNATTIKLATSYDAAMVGNAINLTNTGTAGAALTLSLSYVFANNDEIYLKGRHDVLTSFWNTDYPTPDKADWSAVQPGADSSNVITGVRENGNRLFVFTLNTGNRFDGTNMLTFSKSIGCVSHRTIQNIDDDWMIWLTSRGRIYARNEGASQQEYISRGIHNRFFKNIGLEQLKKATSGLTDTEYTVFVGDYQGEPHRATYDFGSNTWAVDALSHNTYLYANNSSTGEIKPYFASDNGNVYEDDTGDLDDDKAIRFQANLGRTNYGTESDKEYLGAYIYSRNAIGLKVLLAIDDGDPFIAAEIKKSYGQLDYANMQNRRNMQGSTLDISIVGAIKGPAQVIEAFQDMYTMVQEMNGHGQKQ